METLKLRSYNEQLVQTMQKTTPTFPDGVPLCPPWSRALSSDDTHDFRPIFDVKFEGVGLRVLRQFFCSVGWWTFAPAAVPAGVRVLLSYGHPMYVCEIFRLQGEEFRVQ